jgi:glycosidase
MKKFLSLFAFACMSVLAYAQTTNVYPMHWWPGMKWNKVQLMIHDTTGLASDKVAVQFSYPGVKLLKVNKVENRNYLFVDIEVSPTAKPGKFTIAINNPVASEKRSVDFEIKARRQGKGTSYAQGVTSADLIYLLMPDRFSNGDPNNDRIAGMHDQSLNRDTIYDRHGGDLQGVINHLDYLQDLGVTAIWMTPVIENNMFNRTEHGYAFTNHYKIEPRLGGEKAYKQLSNELHKRGMRLVQDAVYNHVGLEHFFFRDKPTKDWFHEWPSFTQTSYKDQTLMDPYASKADTKITSDGWFVTQMPDLNQNNPLLANFLIQHALWSVEEFGVDAWRIDTYIYNDLAFMNRCNKALLDEYPKLHLFGETWVHGTANQAYFVENNLNVPFKSNLPGVTDFQTNLYGIAPALNEPFGWTNGVNKLYTTLSNDFLYKNPMKQVIFLDNHDMTRFITQVNNDTAKLKMGIAWLLTARGIPQLYYGTEILMAGSTHPHDGYVRLDFKGGWAEDKENKFTEAGRNNAENEVFNWTRTLANFRKKSSAITFGKMLQYVPQDGVYVYFRYDEKQTVMCVMNPNDNQVTIDTKRFDEGIKNARSGKDIGTGKTYDLGGKIEVAAKTMLVLELSK